MNKFWETLAWVTIFVSVTVIWQHFGGSDAASANSPEKFQALGVLFSAWAFAGLFFTIYYQNKSSKAQLEEAKELRKETALSTKATNRYAEIEEFRQSIVVLDEMRGHCKAFSAFSAAVGKTGNQQIDERHNELVSEYLKRAERYERIRTILIEDFDNKYFKKYDTPGPTLEELLARHQTTAWRSKKTG